MKPTLLPFIAIFSVVFFPSQVMGQVYYCDGKYSTEACDDNAKQLDLKPLSRTETIAEGQPDGETKSESSSAAESTTGTFTRLRIEKEPVWILDSARDFVQVKSGEVVVKNVGRQVAQQVKVELDVPGKASDRVPMTGPDTLEPGKSGAYKIDEKPLVKRGTPLKVKISCVNCWR